MSKKTYNPQRRRDLLPVWVKVFTWIFMIFGAIVPVALVMGAIGEPINLSLYGLETTESLSLVGVFILVLFTLKGCVAFGLWFEQKWAVLLALIDAILGIVITVFIMFFLNLVMSNGFNLNLRLELAGLIPYLVLMSKIRTLWEEGTFNKNQEIEEFGQKEVGVNMEA